MKRVLIAAVAIVALGAIIGWRVVSKVEGDKALRAQQQARVKAPARVNIAVATGRPILRTLEVVGTVESPYSVKLAPKIAGRIDYLVVREGDPVKPGQVLVKIDPTAVAGEVLAAQSDVAQAQSRYAQAQLTQNPNNVSVATQLRQQQAALSSAQANYNQQEQNYSALVAAAQAAVTDAAGRVASASSGVKTAQTTVVSARANMANAKAKYNRMNTLYKQGFIAAQDVDDARTTYDVAVSALGGANSQLDAAKSALGSANAQKASTEDQLAITKRKGSADVEAAKAAMTQASAALEYARSNRAQVAAYQANLNALKSAVEAAKGQLRQSLSHRSDTNLVSTVEGTVTARSADPGSIASVGQPILTVSYLRWLYVTAAVPVDESHNVFAGQPVSISFDAVPGRGYTGKIAEVNPSADPLSRQFTIRVKLDNPKGTLRPGMYARLSMVAGRTVASVVVPREAVTTGTSGSTVTIVDENNVAHVRPVTLGAQDEAGIEIKDGVQAGEKVVTLSYTPVRDGQKVRFGGGKK